ncbi:hypothetical protein HWV62_32541 [Athelia sp. TMB]|nr:hypothetical protein HWV62_32541 [Athelia sp. TMB]
MQRPSVSTPVVRSTFSGIVSYATKAFAFDTAADRSPSPFTGSANGDADLLAETNADLDALALELTCLLELELTGLLDVPGCFDVVLAALVVPALLDVVVWWLELELEETFLLLSGAATARPPQWRLWALCVKSCASVPVLRFAAAHVARSLGREKGG